MRAARRTAPRVSSGRRLAPRPAACAPCRCRRASSAAADPVGPPPPQASRRLSVGVLGGLALVMGGVVAVRTAYDRFLAQKPAKGPRRDGSTAVVVLAEPPRPSSSRQLTPQTLEIDAAEFGQFVAQQRAALAAARERERKVAAAALRRELHAALSSCRGRVRRRRCGRRFLDDIVRVPLTLSCGQVDAFADWYFACEQRCPRHFDVSRCLLLTRLSCRRQIRPRTS